MFALIQKGGPLMYLIILCSICSVAIFIEKLIYFYKSKIDTTDFITKVNKIVKQNKLNAALELCESTPGPIARILKAGIRKFDRTRDEIQKSIEEAGMHEVPKLEKNIGMLATIAHITPLLGLLGTVSGMITAFRMIQEKAASGIVISPGDLAGGIWEALITTAAGLVVAIPTYVAYNYLASCVNSMVHEMEETSGELVNILIAGGEK